MFSRLLERSARKTRTLLRGMLGAGPQLVVPSRASTPGSRACERTLRVVAKRRETPDAVTLVLRDPHGEPFPFDAGQFGLFSIPVQGAQVQRAYSFSCAPGGEELSITVRRKAGGLISTLLHDHVRESDELRVSGPYGNFAYRPSAGDPPALVLIAGGSGITPLYSILETALRAGGSSRLCLVFGNRTGADIIYREALSELAARHAARLCVRHVLERPGELAGAVEGRLDRAVCARVLDELAPSANARYYLCGPEGMLEEARAALADRGVPEARVLIEHFDLPLARPQLGAASDAARGETSTVVLRHAGNLQVVEVANGTTILEAALAANLRLPFSCTLGGCGACRLRLASGTVALKEPNCLTDAERREGLILACVAQPTSRCVLEW